jgi:hypothetical protein
MINKRAPLGAQTLGELKMKRSDNNYQEKKLNAIEDELTTHAWALFENQVDTDCEYVIKAACFFIQQYGFEVESLPPKLYDAVVDQLQKDAEESWAQDKADEMMM